METMITINALTTLHSHFREGPVMGPLVEYAIRGGSEIVGAMGNTKDGILTADQAVEYGETLNGQVPADYNLTVVPIMIVNEQTPASEIRRCHHVGIKHVKFLPLGRTTNSEKLGTRDYAKVRHVVEACGEYGIFVHFHPEHPNLKIQGRDAEYMFVSVIDDFIRTTKAVIFVEHITDGRAVPLWIDLATSKEGRGRLFVTVTAHHLALSEDGVFGDAASTCKPQIKTEQDRLALVGLVEHNYEWVVAGPDDAPHDIKVKHPDFGKCACGAFTSPFLPGLYAHALDNLLQKPEGREVFENFTSRNLRAVLGLPVESTSKITLVRKPFKIPHFYQAADWKIKACMGDQTINWQHE